MATPSDADAQVMERKVSGDSGDTLWEEAEGAVQDDLEDTTVGFSKEQTLFRKLNHFVTQKHGPRGDNPKRRVVSAEELARHSLPEDLWVCLDGMIFDVGPFLRGEAKHPGGKSIFLKQLEEAGNDAREKYVRWHNPGGNGVRRAPDHYVGDLEGYVPLVVDSPKKAEKQGFFSCCRRRSGA
eukprot:TRINITY_DN26536_c1_g1_i1.p1 TRINITY_DN26536_c1_g1~~TRINITY_DN26536_c1_g1_i1.p1  ORF type:complete len:201 (-),score=35.97 TRINITY_DN26536_c1_g1_i1:72-617(-)